MTEVPSLPEPVPGPQAMLAAEVEVAPVHPSRPGPERSASLSCRQPRCRHRTRRRYVIEHSRENAS